MGAFPCRQVSEEVTVRLMDDREAAWRKDLKRIQQELPKDKQEWHLQGISITTAGIPDITEDEVKRYVEYVLSRVQDPIICLDILPAENGKVALRYEHRTVKFERIRRITGYLVGAIDRWNNAKRSEEKDRVKHL